MRGEFYLLEDKASHILQNIHCLLLTHVNRQELFTSIKILLHIAINRLTANVNNQEKISHSTSSYL